MVVRLAGRRDLDEPVRVRTGRDTRRLGLGAGRHPEREQRDLQQRAIARADDNARRLVEAEQQLTRYKDALRLSIRETSDLEDQLALYQENCECSQ